jgi:hypothetical protein
MLLRGLLVWCVLLAAAIVNGSVRVAWLVPRTGETIGHVLSTLTLSAAILIIAWLTIGWIAPATPREALALGALWLAMTLAFEFGAGHYLFRTPWDVLLQDYDVSRGRVWPLVLAVTAAAPLAAAVGRGLLRSEH